MNRQQSVAAATLIDYVVNTYGREKLPDLLAGIRTYENWTTLSPAVFGVSAEELEAGWQRYLAEQLDADVMGDETMDLESETADTPGAQLTTVRLARQAGEIQATVVEGG